MCIIKLRTYPDDGKLEEICHLASSCAESADVAAVNLVNHSSTPMMAPGVRACAMSIMVILVSFHSELPATSILHPLLSVLLLLLLQL